MAVDYTPVRALSSLAKRSGRVAGQWKQADLDLERERLRQHDKAVALQNAQAEKELALRTKAQEIGQKQWAESTAYTKEQNIQSRADFLKQQEFANKNVEENQAWTQSAPTRELQKAIQERDLQRDNFKWEYSETQKREMAKIQDAIATLRQDDKWTPEQKQNAEKQLWQKYYGILPSKMFDDTPKPTDIYEKSKIPNTDLLVNPQTGAIELDPSIKAENEKKKAEEKVAQDLIEAKAKLAMEFSKALDPNGYRLFKDEEIPKKVNDLFDTFSGKIPMATTPKSIPQVTDLITSENMLKIQAAYQLGKITDEEFQTIQQVLKQDPSKITQILAMIEAGSGK